MKEGQNCPQLKEFLVGEQKMKNGKGINHMDCRQTRYQPSTECRLCRSGVWSWNTYKEETHPLKILQRIFSFMENFHLRSCGTIFATLSTPNTNIYEGGEGSMAKTRQDSTTTTLCWYLLLAPMPSWPRSLQWVALYRDPHHLRESPLHWGRYSDYVSLLMSVWQF